MLTIDVNADLGETTAGIPVADDRAMIQLISSANVACGFHAGDPLAIAQTLRAASQHRVSVGAHVGYRDSAGFGRRFIDYDPDELASEVLYQIGALDALARAEGTRVSYVKPHGALYNAIVNHEQQAKAVVDGVRAFGDLKIMLLPGGVAVGLAEQAGLTVIREAFADRGYLPDGTLVPRRQEGAVITDPQAVSQRVLDVAEHGCVTAIDGTRLYIDATSVCVHGDSPGAVALTQSVVDTLKAHEVSIQSIV